MGRRVDAARRSPSRSPMANSTITKKAYAAVISYVRKPVRTLERRKIPMVRFPTRHPAPLDIPAEVASPALHSWY